MYKALTLVLLLSMTFEISADAVQFSKGPVISNYGENVTIGNSLANPDTHHFKVVFDITEYRKHKRPISQNQQPSANRKT